MRNWLISLSVLGGLFGAAGVALAAAGAHSAGGPTATTAAYFLLFHAVAVIALCTAVREEPTVGLLTAATLLVVGTTLFSGDLALRSLAHVTLVRMAAPTGGVIMILGWLGVAAGLPLALLRASAGRN